MMDGNNFFAKTIKTFLILNPKLSIQSVATSQTVGSKIPERQSQFSDE